MGNVAVWLVKEEKNMTERELNLLLNANAIKRIQLH